MRLCSNGSLNKQNWDKFQLGIDGNSTNECKVRNGGRWWMYIKTERGGEMEEVKVN